jgi:hypothetical protein
MGEQEGWDMTAGQMTDHIPVVAVTIVLKPQNHELQRLERGERGLLSYLFTDWLSVVLAKRNP